ncbi:MAG: hypothetical protein JSR58_04270 [Verrucomicrobia bacterium]|nr:hypothetical protein [Verrucomicrobiota bacterium]
MKKLILAFVVFFLPLSIYANENYPADICFMVADLKYSKEKGIKFCEIQNGIVSVFKGSSFVIPADLSIQQRFLRFLYAWFPRGWAAPSEFYDPGLQFVFSHAYAVQAKNSVLEIFSDPTFWAFAQLPAQDPSDFFSYQGFLFASPYLLKQDEELPKKCPGILIIDRASFPYLTDKYKMTELLAKDPLLASLKPKWKLYKKEYSKNLAAQIASDLGGEAFVIKPRSAFIGRGVIIVKKDELDGALDQILNHTQENTNNPDKAYNYWVEDKHDSFLVEEFVTSDLIVAPHLDNKLYQPTMRVAFVLYHNKGVFDVHTLGVYWKLPAFSVQEPATFMEQHKDLCEPPFYLPVDPEVWNQVYPQLQKALPLLHQQMMKSSP